MSLAIRLTALILLLAAALVSVASSPAAAAIFLVDTEADAPDAAPGDGLCRAAGPPAVAGRCTLRAAIQETNAGGDNYIYLPAGTYRLTFVGAGGGPDARRSLRILRGLRLTGAGALHTIIDAGGLDRVMVVGRRDAGSPWPHVHIERVTLTGGRATDPRTGESGGGLSVGEATVYLRACSIFKNQAHFGGGIAATGNLRLSHVTISGNEAGQGGGMSLGNGAYRIADTVVSRNTADEGGGIHLVNGGLNLTGGEISGNVAALRGGGLFLAGDFVGGSFAYLDRVRVLKNVAQSGGGIYADLHLIDLSATEVSGNSASDDGGGLYFPAPYNAFHLPSGVSSQIERSSISENRAGRDGGGLFNGIALNLHASTFSGNQAGRKGGGFINMGGGVNITYATIYSNEAATGGGFVNQTGEDSTDRPVSGPLTYRSSIIAKNKGGSCWRIRPGRLPDFSPITSLGFNLLDDELCTRDSSGSDLFPADPMLGPLATNGGLTRNHMPQVGSPAIDAILGDWPHYPWLPCEPSGTSPGEGADQRGVERPQGAACDIGAVEVSQLGEPPQN